MLMNTYGRFPVTFVKGEACKLYDDKGKEYIDFASGIGVNSVGHAHPEWVKAVAEQAGTLAHVSNLYHTLPAARLAAKLADLSGLKSVFFANSGAESNEGLIKLARKYSRDKYGEGRAMIVTLKQSFHGRTVTTLSATGQDVFHKNFHPFTEGFVHVPANDTAALTRLAGAEEDAAFNGSNPAGKICAVMLEAVQGEGGVLPLNTGYVKAVAKLCAEKDWLLLFDEVQTGIGRTGKWFGFQHYGVTPDAISFAKGIAGGLPLGGFIAGEKCADVLQPGDHATTFGGNPIVCAAALATLNIIEEALPSVTAKGKALMEALSKMDGLSNVRGAGLMIGATVDGAKHESARALASKLLEAGLVCLTAGGDSLRLMPPLTVSEAELEAGVAILQSTLK
jgi:acetylornithine/N-succinyldiaminopimelate aminotransferase